LWKEAKVAQEKPLAGEAAPQFPKGPRAIIQITRTAASRVTRTTPASLQLKGLLSDISEGSQQTIADKIVEEEA